MPNQEKIYSIRVQGWPELIDGAENAQKALIGLDKQLLAVNADLAKTPKGSPEYAALLAQQQNIEKAIKQTQDAMRLFQNSLENTGAKAAALREKLGALTDVKLPSLDRGSDAFRETILDIQRTQAELDSLTLSQQAVADGFIAIGDAANSVEGVATALKSVKLKESFAVGPELEQAQADAAALEQQLVALAVAAAGAARTQGELKAALVQLEDVVIPNLDVNSADFVEANTAAQRLDQQLEALRKTGEAAAKGFKGLGNELNTVEGIAVQITALEAGLAFAQTDEERQQIQKVVVALEEQRIGLEATARAAGFAEGSIGRLEAELQAAQEVLRRIPQGTAAFAEQRKKVDELSRAVQFAGRSLREQRDAVIQLRTSLVSAGVSGAALFASMVEGSEDAQRALLILQQAQQVLAFIEQTTAAFRQAADLAAASSMQKRTAATVENTVATEANAVAAAGQTSAVTAGTAASTASTSAIGGLTKGLRVLWATMVANPVIAIVAGVAALGFALYQAAKSVKPLADAFNFMEDALGGVGGGIKELTKNFDLVIETVVQLGEAIAASILAPAKAVIAAFAALRSGENPFTAVLGEAKKLESEFADVADAAGKVGEAIADGFKKGFDRSRALRELDAREALNQVRKQSIALQEAQLGGTRSTEDARRALRLETLREEAAINAERLQVEQRLTDAEVAILRSGNAAKIAELEKLFNARGKTSDDFQKILDGFTKTVQAETAVLQEQEAQRLTAIQDRIKLIDADLKLQQARLAAVQSFDNQEVALAKEKAAELEKLRLADAAGELKGLEFATQRLALLQDFANKEAAQAQARAQFNRDLAAAVRQGQIDNDEFELEQRRKTGALTLGLELATIAKIQDAKRAGLEADLAAAQDLAAQGNDEAYKRAVELNNQLDALNRETITRNDQAVIDSIDRQAAARERLLAVEAAALALAGKLADIDNAEATAELEAQADALERQKGFITSNRRQAELLRQELALQTQQYDLQRSIIRDNYNAQTAQLDLEIKGLEQQKLKNEELIASGAAKTKELKEQNDLLNQQIKLKEATKTEVRVQAVVEIDKLDTKELQDKGETIAADLKRGFERAGRGLSGIVKDLIQGIAIKKLGEAAGKAYAEEFSKQAAALAGELLELQSTLNAAAVAQAEADAAHFQEQADAAQERIDALNQSAEDSAANILSLEQSIAEARGANADALQTQLDAEAERRAGLQQQIRIEEREKAKFEREREAAEAKAAQLRKRQAVIEKSLAISAAIINTAGAVTAALKNPGGPLGLALAAVVGALGAAQVANIIAQPVEAASGGLLTADGGIVKAADGGVVRGPSHAGGGVRGTGDFAGIEVEGGEAIIPKAATAANRPLIDALLQSGGEALKLAAGTAELIADLGPAAAAAAPGRNYRPLVPRISRPKPVDAEEMQALRDEIKQMREDTNAGLQRLSDKKNYTAITDVRDALDRTDEIEDDATL